MGDILRKQPDLTGIYHFSGTPDLSWADFALKFSHKAAIR